VGWVKSEVRRGGGVVKWGYGAGGRAACALRPLLPGAHRLVHHTGVHLCVIESSESERASERERETERSLRVKCR
jgi:hypothetical protein